MCPGGPPPDVKKHFILCGSPPGVHSDFQDSASHSSPRRKGLGGVRRVGVTEYGSMELHGFSMVCL